jgi:perosamine synthetase
MKEIMKIAKKKKIYVIEDCAHAIGTLFSNRHVGTFGDVGCFSFYPTKNITTIEGGMIITNSKENQNKFKSLRNHSMTKSLTQRYKIGNPWDYDIIEPGYNFRLDEIRSALGSSQLKRIKKMNQLRRNACKYYNKKLQKIKGITIPEISINDSCHLYILKINQDYKISRDKLYKKLLKNKIRSTVHYKPLHKFSIFKKYDNSKDFVNTSQIYEEILSLPLYPQITQKQQDKVIKCISEQ